LGADMSRTEDGGGAVLLELVQEYPRISQAIWLLVLFVLLVVAFGAVLGIFGGALGQPVHEHPAAIAVVNLAAAGVVLKRGLKRTGAPFSQVFRFPRFRASLLFPMSVTVVGVHILLSEVDNLLRTVLPMPAWLAEVFGDLSAGGTSLWGSVLVLVVVAPLTEELLFRGLILRGFLSQYTVRRAVFASSLLFALIHLNPWQFATGAVLGVLFAWWFIETRSLLPCLYGHALMNSLGLLIGAVLRVEIRGYTGGFVGPVEFQPLWFDALGILLVGVGLWLLVGMFRRARLHPKDSPAVSSQRPAL